MPKFGNLRKGRKAKFREKGKNKPAQQDEFLGFTDNDNRWGMDESNIPYQSLNELYRKYKVNTPRGIEIHASINLDLEQGYGIYAVFKRPNGQLRAAKLQNGKFVHGPQGKEVDIDD